MCSIASRYLFVFFGRNDSHVRDYSIERLDLQSEQPEWEILMTADQYTE